MSLFTTYLEAAQKKSKKTFSCLKLTMKNLKNAPEVEKFSKMNAIQLKVAAISFIKYAIEWYLDAEDADGVALWFKTYKKSNDTFDISGIPQNVISKLKNNLKRDKKFVSMNDAELNNAAGEFIIDACDWLFLDEGVTEEWMEYYNTK
jgi:hypothetical protein